MKEKKELLDDSEKKMLSDDLKRVGEIKEDGSLVFKGVKDEVKIGEVKEKLTKEDMENLVSKDGLIRYYKKIKLVLKEYMDMDEEHYSLVSLWVLGTYIHRQFSSYPYLYFNAMKGSGKTRLMKIVSNLSYNGKLVGSMTESVLFRTAKDRTLCIDEFENINAKGSENLKLLLNAAYKRGTTIERMSKKKTPEGESQVVEAFEVYCPIAMANIWGMDNVLSDRCIGLILEKSSKTQITKLIENFEYDMEFQAIRGGLTRLTENIKESSNIFGQLFVEWNDYVKKNVSEGTESFIKEKQNQKKNVSFQRETYIPYILYVLFHNINKTNISGRDLELFLPLFIIADMCGDKKILDQTLETAKKIVSEKKESDRDFNKDVKLYDFIAQSVYDNFVGTKTVARDFSYFIGEDEKYNTPRSIGLALNRLKLVIEKRNTGRVRQVRLNVLKAQEKMLMFQEQKDVNDVSNVSNVNDVSNVSKFTNEEIEKAGFTREELEKTLK